MPVTPRAGSGEMFDSIATRYDLLNRVMSLGMDQGWRRSLVEALAPALATSPKPRVLDLATGTADVAIAIAQRFPECQVTGVDPSEGMLGCGDAKIAAMGLAERISLRPGEAEALPFEDGRFDAVCIAFGIRNVPDRAAGLREMRRVTRSGGRIAILELGEPRRGVLAPFARAWVHHGVPVLGRLISGAGREYRYLQSSIQAFPPPETFVEMMRAAGLESVDFQDLGFGAAQLYLGEA